MRKNDLIKLLQGIEGNPEIVLWNGLVGDWMGIKGLSESYLTKITKEHYIFGCEAEEKISKKDFDHKLSPEAYEELVKRYSKFPWEVNEYVTAEDITEKRYKIKRVVYIDAKLRGETSYDRLGSISY